MNRFIAFIFVGRENIEETGNGLIILTEDMVDDI